MLTFSPLFVMHHQPQVTIKDKEGTYQGAVASSFDNYIFYVNTALPRVAGKDFWGPRKCHHETISSAMHTDGLPCITVGTEAFLVLCWENCHKKWLYLYKCDESGEEPDQKCQDMATPFTDAKSGQQPFGGWNKAGRKRYAELCKMITEARGQPYCAPTEAAVLHSLRRSYVFDNDGALKRPKKKQKKQEDSDEEEELEFDDNY